MAFDEDYVGLKHTFIFINIIRS